MSNALREKMLRFEQLLGEPGTQESKAVVEALFLQTSILNERLFCIEQALRERERERERENTARAKETNA